MDEFYVYQLRIEGDDYPFYIGKGKNDRAWNHLKLERSDPNKHKQNTIKKAQRIGKKILVEIIKDKLSEYDAFINEIYWISEYGRADLGLGPLTNMTDGGEGVSGRSGELNHFYGKSHSDETKRKISESRIGRFAGENNPNFGKVGELNPNYGKKHSEETKAKISESNKGKRSGVILTEEHRKSLSEANSKPKTKEQRIKMSESAMGPRKRVTCPHCGKVGGANNMPRYHFDNCKEKT